MGGGSDDRDVPGASGGGVRFVGEIDGDIGGARGGRGGRTRSGERAGGSTDVEDGAEGWRRLDWEFASGRGRGRGRGRGASERVSASSLEERRGEEGGRPTGRGGRTARRPWGDCPPRGDADAIGFSEAAICANE
jgi:hypothetical protein